jgi:twitching motility protein PilU
VLLDTIMEKRGLVLFVGGTGSGKSTSLAALIDHRNRNSGGHIITIEDPVEFVHRTEEHHQPAGGGVDTRSFHAALKNTLRQAPDVILIGEIRDRRPWSMPWPSPRPGIWPSPPCTPTTPTRRWIASSTSSRKSADPSCSTTLATTSRPLSPSGW